MIHLPELSKIAKRTETSKIILSEKKYQKYMIIFHLEYQKIILKI